MSSEKDILEKTLESKNDVFADICNVLLFNGQKIINVISISKLSDKQVSMFSSDFKFIAEYFVSKENKIDYKGSKETIKYGDEFFELMEVLSGDKRIETEYNLSKINGEGGKINNMCELLDRIENRGIAIGKEEGRTEGKEEIILKMIEKNYDDNEIMQITGASEEKIKELKGVILCQKN